MENFLSEIKSKANKVAKKSGEFFELSKIKLNIANTKSDISSQFKLLGEMVYVAHRDSIEVDAEKFEEIIKKITIFKYLLHFSSLYDIITWIIYKNGGY